jgi:hypothetical protein
MPVLSSGSSSTLITHKPKQRLTIHSPICLTLTFSGTMHSSSKATPYIPPTTQSATHNGCPHHLTAASKLDRGLKTLLAARLVRQDDGTINFAKVCEIMVRLGPRIKPIHKVLVGTVPSIVRGLGNLADDPKTRERKLGPPEQLIKDLSLAKVANAEPEAEPEDVQKSRCSAPSASPRISTSSV